MQFPAERPPWGGLDVTIILAFFLLIMFYPSLGFSWLPAFVYCNLVYNYGISDFMINFAAQFLLVLLVIALVVGWCRKASLSQVGFRHISVRNLAVYGFGWGVLIFTAVVLIGFLIQILVPVPPQQFETALKDASLTWQTIVLVIIGAVFAPFYEEILFRGIIYPVFRARMGVWGGIAVSALIFSLIHMDPIRILPLFVGGAGLAYIYEKSGSIYAAWAAHGTWNFIMAMSLFVKT
ncbi:MAG: lysostaphin resistance A-like protein [Methylocystaceae bacterium]